jgi:hypothetical protein
MELSSPILTFEDLCRLADHQQPLQRPAAVERWLKREKVPFRRDARGRPFTTVALMFPDERTRLTSLSEPDWGALDLRNETQTGAKRRRDPRPLHVGAR